jgi:tRNA(Ile)-lysidine synthase TilS/MesJ
MLEENLRLSCCAGMPPDQGGHATSFARSCVSHKIDLFMRAYILPTFNPNQIHWWLSLSGGKDSFVMAHVLRDWYEQAGLHFKARGFIINQWGGAAAEKVGRSLDWLPIDLIDARDDTRVRTGYERGQQAPCRACSDVRHDSTDALLDRVPSADGDYHFVARGLHLSDMATSLVWRFFRGESPSRSMLEQGKGRPVAHIGGRRYLVKPLSFVREFETQLLSKEIGFRHACCGCPACRYPSRRDIVEETLLQLFESDLWEFDIPGMNEFIAGHGNIIDMKGLRSSSIPGRASKHNHLPHDFSDFSLDETMRSLSISSLSSIGEALDFNSCLDDIALTIIAGDAPEMRNGKIPAPALLARPQLNEPMKRAVAALGPFWGAFHLSQEKRFEAHAIQQAAFGIDVDDKLSNVHRMLRRYYGEDRYVT